MRLSKNHGNKSERGQSLVELAISFTLLLLLLSGTIDLGRAFFTWVALRDGAQEGAAYASIDPTNVTEIENRVYSILEASGAVPDPRTNVTVTRTLIGDACLGNIVQVDADFLSFPITMPFLSTVIGSDTLTIRASIEDTILRPTCGE
jgi:hypothetical protein